jgi:hypothetical protein
MGTNLQNRIDDPADPPKADEDGSVEAAGCSGSCLCHPDSCCHRSIALFLMCILGFGSYFCYDNPGALQVSI